MSWVGDNSPRAIENISTIESEKTIGFYIILITWFHMVLHGNIPGPLLFVVINRND